MLPEFTLASDGSLAALGWTRSWRRRQSEDASGKPLPWFTYPAIRFLSGRSIADRHVFEFGAGNSTLWWAARAGRVTACEHDPAWAGSLAARLPANVVLLRTEDGPGYEACASGANQPIDILVVDGIRREACIRTALPLLPSRAVVVWDNAEREDGLAGATVLRQAGWRELPFWGLGPINTYEWCTSVWYRDGNVLGI